METPRVSVLVASVNGLPMIDECLAALQEQLAAARAEVVVADATDEQTRAAIRERFPDVRLLEFARGTTIPQLRTAAFDASRGAIVAVTEDHCIPDAGWLREILRLHSGPVDVAGGPVENGARERLVDWAVFLCEYAPNVSPVEDGASSNIPGVNVAYKRELLERHRERLEEGFWEGIIHPRLIAEGARLVSSPAMVVLHKKRFGFFYFIGQRFHYSRYYAATRAAGAPAPLRFAYALATPLLPPLLAFRITRVLLGKRRHRRWLLLCSPILVIFYKVWALGEAVGYLAGAGRSLARVE